MKEEQPPEEQLPGNDIDCGEPLAELATLRETPSAGFRERIRRGIGRRRLAAETTQVTVYLPFMLLMEFLDILFQSLSGKITGKGGPNNG